VDAYPSLLHHNLLKPSLPKTDLKAECCNQFKGGASRDPRAMDISGTPCSYYKDRIVNDKSILTSECTDFFEKMGLSVGECK